MSTHSMCWTGDDRNGAKFLAACLLFAILVMSFGCKKSSSSAKALPRISSFELTNQAGDTFGSKNLAGKPYVTAFFFTSCVTICPKIMGAMASLQSTFKAKQMDVHLVAITVDPETDTPERLKAAGQKAGADFSQWTFLTGTKAKVTEVVVQNFKTFIGAREDLGDNLFDIGHGARFVVVDGQGSVLGNYEHTEFGLSELVKRLERL